MPRGRPSGYKPEYAVQAEKLCRLGATDVELADFFGVSDRTIYRWANQYDDFCQALKAGKDAADERVERSLYHRATGYTFDAEKIFQFQGEVVRAPYREHVPPDTTAAIFWLKNRRKEDWKDRHDSTVTHRREPNEYSDDELEAIIRASRSGSGAAEPAKGKGKPKRLH